MAYHPDSPDRDNEESRDALDNIQSNFQHLEEIADNIPEILDGSIIDDNLDDDNPSNGYYWRTEKGAQICIKEILTLEYAANDRLQATWNFPVSFVDNTYTVNFLLTSSGTDWDTVSRGEPYNLSRVSESVDSFQLRAWFYNGVWSDGDTLDAQMLWAIGRWK